MPPLPPTLSAEEIAAIYRNNNVGIKLGAVFMVLATMLLLPWTAAISAVLEQADKPLRALSKTQLASGVLAFTPLMFASFMFACAAYRPERSADLIYLMNDLGWIVLVMTPGAIQPLAIGLAILFDKSANPLFPRWLAYLNLWLGTLFAGGVLNPLFKTGPFAWNGIIAFWIPAGIFSIWVGAMVVGLLRAAKKIDAREELQAGGFSAR
ncbi:MAG: hypothetical protein ABWZ40_14160 [Caulobacterales bacterium]